MKFKLSIIVLLSSILFSCANPFTRYYTDLTRGTDIAKLPNIIIPKGEPKLFYGTDPKRDERFMTENGYMMIGYSSFNGPSVDIRKALAQAKRVHASVVIVYSRYRNTVTGAFPLILPNTQTSTTSLHGSIYGYGGLSDYSGTAHTTTYGSSTVYVPFSVNRYDYMATYWVKAKFILGVHVEDLSPELKRKIGSNKGALVCAVVKNSPAFKADILEGDVIKKIGDIRIYDAKSVAEAVRQYKGQKVTIIILRDGKEIKKEVLLNN